MQRVVPIRLTKADRAEFAKLTTSARRKANRIRKNYGIDLSSDVSLPKIETFRTRKQYNQWKEQVQNFTNRANLDYQFVKNPFGTVASKKELNEMKRKTKIAQERARKLISGQMDKPWIFKGQVRSTQGQRMQMMGGPAEAAGVTVPPDFDFNKMRTQRQFTERKEAIDKRMDVDYYDRKMERMQLNFMDILSLSFGSDADELLILLNELTPKEFWEIYQMFEGFDFALYDSDGQDVDANLGQLHRMENYTEAFKATREQRAELDGMIKNIKDFNNGNVDRSLENF